MGEEEEEEEEEGEEEEEEEEDWKGAVMYQWGCLLQGWGERRESLLQERGS